MMRIHEKRLCAGEGELPGTTTFQRPAGTTKFNFYMSFFFLTLLKGRRDSPGAPPAGSSHTEGGTRMWQATVQ